MFQELKNSLEVFDLLATSHLESARQPHPLLQKVKELLVAHPVDTKVRNESNEKLNNLLTYTISLLTQPNSNNDSPKLTAYLSEIQELISLTTLTAEMTPYQRETYIRFRDLLVHLRPEVKRPENSALLDCHVFSVCVNNASLWATMPEDVLQPFVKIMNTVYSRLNFKSFEGGSPQEMEINTNLLRYLEQILRLYLESI